MMKKKKKKKKKRKRKKKRKKKVKPKKAKSEEDSDSDESSSSEEKKKKKKKLPSDPEKIKAAIKKLDESLEAWKIKKTEKDELKTVALGTSKINYIDPRITVAWCKRMDVPVEKLFSKSLLSKFPWAMKVKKDYKFGNK